ncbi:MAG: tRNA-specific adenosine deaminase [Methanomassiliicoccales archaeon PtaU1.Bin124]|nr:MAG: tRNA-specific adenosine deaminase [Methanomassiliicoccales archaeon PtaU1.Bin124]
MDRPDNDTYFMAMAELVSTRSTCLRRKVGAVIVKEKRVLSTGYNGAPKGLRHCEEVGCVRQNQNIETGTRHELCRGVHAEQNAVVQAAYFGTSIKDASIYTTCFPCVLCTKILLNAGISEIIYMNDYIDPLSKEILNETDIVVRKFEEKNSPLNTLFNKK